jgi:hypothetical protein
MKAFETNNYVTIYDIRVLTVVTMKIAFFWNVTPCSSLLSAKLQNTTISVILHTLKLNLVLSSVKDFGIFSRHTCTRVSQ